MSTFYMQTGGTGDAKRTYFPSRKWKESRSAGRRIRHRGNITFSYDSLGIGDKEREMCWEESYSRVTKREKNKKKNTHREDAYKNDVLPNENRRPCTESDVPWEIVTLFNTFAYNGV